MQEKLRFSIGGMTCQACASRLEKVLNKKEFIQSATVNFASEEAQIDFDNSQTTSDDLIAIIKKTGFTATPKNAETPLTATTEQHVTIQQWLLLIINIIFWINMGIMVFGSPHYMIPPMGQFVLASIVQLFLATHFYKGAWASIKGGLANMDVLVTLGTVSIYLYSSFMLFYLGSDKAMGHIYFEASVMVIGFVSLGKYLENRTKKQSLNSLGLLIKLTPKQVWRLQQDQWEQVAMDQVHVGDTLRANTGERVAADGVIVSGQAWLDESHLTGESNPQERTQGQKVLAGALVTDGSIHYQAQELGSHTLLGDMMTALSEAQGSKAPIARLADRVAAVFVPVVVAIALLTFALTWGITGDWVKALIHAVAVLVIACPCALGLATPAAIMVGMGRAAKYGIWFKDATAMEQAAHVDTVVLDKTGTLTQGQPHVEATYLVGHTQTQLLYQLAASVEQSATHPLANALVKEALTQQVSLLPVSNIRNTVGQGIQADIEDVGTVKVGTPAFCHLELPSHMDTIWSIASVVAVCVNDQPIGAFALADALKNDSRQAIERLKEHHIEVYVMSGDHPSVVNYIAQQLGIEYAFGSLSPRDKAEKIAELKAQGKVVAMVGDGINDAPALARADVSFAMKDGADVAEHTASATLMQHSVNQMVDALLIAQATLRNIKQNLFFAFFYNVLGIPLAAFGFLSPVIAGAAMACSSVSVLCNALRLKNKSI